MKCFATIRQTCTDPNVAMVAPTLVKVSISADRTGEEDCTDEGGLLFAICLFAAIRVDPCWVRSFDLIRTLPVGFVSDRWIDPVTRLRLRA